MKTRAIKTHACQNLSEPAGTNNIATMRIRLRKRRKTILDLRLILVRRNYVRAFARLQRSHSEYATFRLRRGPSISLHEPASEHNEFASDEEHPKNDLVMLRQPARQVDIEVVRAVGGEPGSQVLQGTSAAIDGQYGTLQENNSGQDRSPAESTQHPCDG